MSVSFTIPQEPEVPHKDTCMCYNDGQSSPDCPDCKGEGEVEFMMRPYLNFTNTNTAAILDVIYPRWHDLYGSWSGKTLHEVRRKLFRALNIKRVRSYHLIPEEVGDNFYSAPLTDEGLVRRLRDLQEMVVKAIQNGWEVSYG